MRKPITHCPHCGSTEGFYTKTTYVRVPSLMSFDGKPQYNGEMYDNAESCDGGRIAYCQSCERVICRVSTLQRQWAARQGGGDDG